MMNQECKQPEPMAYAVFCRPDEEFDYRIFADLIDAYDYADQDLQEGDPEPEVVPLYPK